MNAAGSTPRSGKILCVDLDGTLLSTDTLGETILALLRQSPLFILIADVLGDEGQGIFEAGDCPARAVN